jgi:hypothetical protein
LLSGWSKIVYFAAALQTLQMIDIFRAYELAYLWALPALIARGFIGLGLGGARCGEGRRS